MPTQCRRSNSRTSISCTSRAIIESSWERIVLRTKVPGSESSTANSLHGAKVPRSESSRERKFQGAKRPGSESSRERIGQGPIGTFAPGSELARERKGCESCTLRTVRYKRLGVASSQSTCIGYDAKNAIV